MRDERLATALMPATPLVSAQGAPAEVLFRDVHALDPRAGLDARIDLRVRGGEVAEMGEARSLARGEHEELIECAGEHRLVPAFFDPHAHLRTPGQEHKEDLETGTRAAAAGGFGALLAMPNTDPVVDCAPVLRSLRGLAMREARVPVGFLPAITRGLAGAELTEMAELRDEGAPGFTDDGRPVTSAQVMRLALRYQRLCGGVLALHEEDVALAHGGVMHEGPVSAALGLAGIPRTSESTMVARDIELARHEGARVHIQHLSVAESVHAVAAGKAAGVRVSAEVTPHHLVLCDEDVRSLDTALKVNPPLARPGDRDALREGLRTGVIDCIATDHAPHAQEEKEVPFEEAPMGTTGLETAFAALYTELVLPGLIELPVLVERLTAGAALFGLPTPAIAAGAPANLALLDLDAVWVAGEQGWESRSRCSCFAGRALRGRALVTIAAGRVAYRERSFSLVAV